VELCHNWGTENDASFAGYKSGNVSGALQQHALGGANLPLLGLTIVIRVRVCVPVFVSVSMCLYMCSPAIWAAQEPEHKGFGHLCVVSGSAAICVALSVMQVRCCDAYAPNLRFPLPCVQYVDDLEKACARWTAAGVRFKKRPEEGSMRHIAFLLDPDSYWIEVIRKGGREQQ
jgi:hypothetical protein